jgi:hypothetical protein
VPDALLTTPSSRSLRLLLLRVSALFLAGAVSATAQPRSGTDPLRQGATGRLPAGAVALVAGRTIGAEAAADHLARLFARPGKIGEELLDSLIDEALVQSELARRGLSVKPAEVEAKFAELDARVRKSHGKGLGASLAERGVDIATFKRRLGSLVALEKLVPMDLKLPPGRPVQEVHQQAWLRQKRQDAKIVRDRSQLPPGALVKVGDRLVTSRRFVHELVELGDRAQEVRRGFDVLVQNAVLDAVLAELKLEIKPSDIRFEWERRERAFEGDPLHKGVKYADLVRQQTTWSPDEFRSTMGFRVHAGVTLIGRSHFDIDAVVEAYEKNKAYFGPIMIARHVLVRAQAEGRAGLPRYEQALGTIKQLQNSIAGGRDFAEVAKLHSEDGPTRFSGGRLPQFTPLRGSVPRALREAAMKLQPGQMAPAPIRSERGWHLLLLEERRPVPPLAEVETELRRLLAEDFFRTRVQKEPVILDLSRL